MKAVVVENYDSIDGISIKEMPLPGLAAGQVRVKIGAAAVGFVDGLKVQGRYQTKDPLPFVPGTEFAGTVDATADGVTAFKPGASVIGMTRSGALAEYIAVPAAALKPLPPDVALEAGASFQANYLTGLYALSARAELREGEILLVLGAAGGVGIAAVQLGKLLGARVIAAASTAEKRDFAVRYGADETIDYTKADWRDTLKALTGGNGPDVIFDPVGGDMFDESTRCIAFGGRLLVIGFTSGRIASVATNIPLIKGFSVIGVRAGEYGRRFPDKGRENQDAVWALAAEGRIRPRVDSRYKLADWRRAFEAMRDSRMIGKIVIEP